MIAYPPQRDLNKLVGKDNTFIAEFTLFCFQSLQFSLTQIEKPRYDDVLGVYIVTKAT